MLLTKRNLEIHVLCSTDCTRPNINAIQITEQHTVATNGSVLIKVSQPDSIVDDYPIAMNKKSDAIPDGGVLLDREDAEHLTKQMIKGKSHPFKDLCKLKNINIKKHKIDIGIADPAAKREQTMTYSICENAYPNIDNIFPDVTMTHIRINASELIHVLSILRSYNVLTHGVDLFVPNVSSMPIVIKARDDDTGQEASALVMPLHHDGIDYHGKELL